MGSHLSQLSSCGIPSALTRPTYETSTLSSSIWKIDARWASSEEEVREAQSLRYRVFSQEMGAHLSPPSGTPLWLDVDRFDAFCEHLLVYAYTNDSAHPGILVGTYRLLSPSAAVRAGGFYTDTEFDLSPLSHLRPHAVELGRSCVHPGWRSGGVIMALWTALGNYMVAHQLDTMIGCASVAVNDGGKIANLLWQHLGPTHLVAPQWQVRPHTPLPIDREVSEYATVTQVNIPPLIKGYLRCGARLLGPPALDAAFNTADLPMMLQLDQLTPHYRKHFLAG